MLFSESDSITCVTKFITQAQHLIHLCIGISEKRDCHAFGLHGVIHIGHTAHAARATRRRSPAMFISIITNSWRSEYLHLMLSEIVIRCYRDLATLVNTDWSNTRVVSDNRFPLLAAHARIVLAINCLGRALDLAIDENSHINTAVVTG